MKKTDKKRKYPFWTILFWIAIWEILSLIIHQRIILVSPFETIIRLFSLIQTSDFWLSVLHSSLKIIFGFFLAFLSAVILAFLAYKNKTINALLAPFTAVIKAVPVACFIILILVWIPSRNLSIIISFLMVFPILYENILKGLQECDPKLLEMAYILHVPKRNRITAIYLSSVLPYLESACSLGLSIAWKSGIAAEVIGNPAASIGTHLYDAKIYLDTADLFAWTLVIILLSVFFRRLFLKLIHFIILRIEAGE